MSDIKIGMHLPRRGPLATGEGVSTIARRAEELGFHSLWTGDHIAFPLEEPKNYPYSKSGRMTWNPTTPWADPFVSLSWAGAQTKQIKLGTSILILAMRSPVVVAKSVATLDLFTGGRVMLGVGVGWLEGEFELAGQSFADRGSRTTEGIRLLKACFGDEHIEFHGKHYDFPTFAIAPKPAQREKLPILCGGFSAPAMRRVAEVADGWLPSHLLPDEYAAKLVELRGYVERAGRSMSEITLAITPGQEHPIDYDLVQRYADVGLDLVVGDANFNGTLAEAVASMEAVARRCRLKP